MRPALLAHKGDVLNFSDFRKQLAAIGREINLDTVAATRKLVVPLHEATPGADINVRRDVQYGPDERQRLDIFTPASGFDPSRPVLVFVHGGGFIAGDKHTEGSPIYSNIGQWAVRNGCNGVVITYRLAPKHQWPSGIEDLRAVVDFIQQQGIQHGIDASRLFLMGQSAGAAHVASYVANADLYAPKAHGISGIILLSGIYSYELMPPSPMEPAYLGTDRSVYPARSTLQGLSQTDVPMLISLTEFDPPQFERQTLDLLSAIQSVKAKLPAFVYAIGQNHLSVAMYLGLPGDLVAPQLKSFIELHS